MDDVPFEDRVVPVSEIHWERSFWWWHPITRAIHPAMRVSALATSIFALLSLELGFWLAATLFAPRPAKDASLEWTWRSLGSLRLAPIEVGQSRLFETLGVNEFAYLTFCAFWITGVCGFFGGILARRAAVELGQRTIAPWGETLRLVGSRSVSMLWITGLHLVAIAILLMIPFALGLVARLGPMQAVAGVLLLCFLPLIWPVGRLVLSMFVCFPLAVTAVTVEKKADAFEGFSRANACFFQRPVVSALLIIALGGVGWVGYQLVYWLYLVGWHWLRDAFLSGAGLGIGDLISAAPTDVADRANRVGGWIKIGATITRFVVASFGFSYFWSAAAAMYLILRRSVYNTNMDEIDSPSTAPTATLPTIPAPPEAPKPDPSTGA